MLIKKFQGKSVAEATAKLKHELGADAMILATKRLPGRDSKAFVEISAMPSGYASVSDAYSELKADMMNIKDMISLMNASGRMVPTLNMGPTVLNIYANIIRSGVNEQNARIILERAGALGGNQRGNQDKNVASRVVKEFAAAIKTSDAVTRDNGKQKILSLVGTTGVGKTTTVAKLAARFMLESKKRVGLISIDNYRIGAMEQIKAYAKILGIPCYPAVNRRDLDFVLRKLSDKDVILIDTAGQSQYDQARIAELKEMISGEFEIGSHLLLSVATSQKEMRKTAANFKPLGCGSCIFTKIDEAERHGAIINHLMETNLPISFLTNGQNVPEDIEAAARGNIAKLVLNKK
jgi:flagellar biosynthesis protein FlhF